jgi:hypothetical protein
MLPCWRVSNALSCQDYVVSVVDEWNLSMKQWWSDTDRRNWYTVKKMCPTNTLSKVSFFLLVCLCSCILFIHLSPPLLNSFSILFICHSYHHSLPLAVFISLILSQFREILLKTCCYWTRVCSVLHCCIDFPQVTFHFEHTDMYIYSTWIILDLYILPQNIIGTSNSSHFTSAVNKCCHLTLTWPIFAYANTHKKYP